MAIWKTFRITDAVNDISNGKFVLPVIQRPLVWTEDKITLLFDTLLKGDSFGGIIVIEEEQGSEPLFNFRPFTIDGNTIASRQVDKLSNQQLFVIDGQQRLQAFYIGLKGSINSKVLYFDLYSDFNSEYEFRFELETSKLPKQSKENADRPIPEHFWYPVSSLLEKLKNTGKYKQVVRDIIAQNNIDDETRREYIEENILSFYENVLNSETLGVSKVIVNKNQPELERQRIVELFIRLNDGGTKLSTFDLVASKLKGFSWQMEGFLKNMLDHYGDIGLSQDNLIKLLFLLQDNHRKEMASIDATDASFAINNRERIGVTLKALRDFLEHSKTIEYYKDGNRSFIPLFFIAYHLFHSKIPNNQLLTYFDNHDAGNHDFPLIKNWLYHSLVNGVFRSRGAGWIPYKTGIRKILDAIKQYKGSSFPAEALYEVYSGHPITFTRNYTANNLDSLDGAFIYYLMYDRSKTIRINDIDHIMPKSILEAKNFDMEKINSIKNFQLLDYSTNRGSKNGKPFAEWINDPECVKGKQTFIRLHLIPTDENLWSEDKFEEFAEARSILILDKLLAYCQ